jgi:hypothetical protein
MTSRSVDWCWGGWSWDDAAYVDIWVVLIYGIYCTANKITLNSIFI